MITALLCFFFLRSTVDLASVDLWTERNGTVDPGGQCSCEAFLPGTTFPMGELVQLEQMAVQIRSCNHGGISRLSKPIISQLNAHLVAGHIYGGWGKDSRPLPGSENMYWYSASTDAVVRYISVYADYYRLIMRQAMKTYDFNAVRDWRGTGNNYIVRANTLYYQYTNPFSMAKFNMTTQTAEYRVVPSASNRFSYHYSPYQNLDFAAKESGLWITYATEASKGKLVLGKIDKATFTLKEVWQTSVYKPSLGNAFMVCGVLYATRSVDTNTEEIFYTYDTRSRKESYVSIPFEKFQENYMYLDYNPTDQKLYMYNNGYYVSYHVWFHQNNKTNKPQVLM
ncbi:olfactomedin-4-like [Salminus brasiliensis]|uniref:olfactomedin-4-like n=1 Tax=Salminus brasiliensis TaxID=930266 RepID=UPI003B830B71